MADGECTYDHNDEYQAVPLMLPRVLKMVLGALLLFINQRWIFLHDTSCHYRTIFLWFYLEHLPEMLAYALSLAVNLVAAYLIVMATVRKPLPVTKTQKK